MEISSETGGVLLAKILLAAGAGTAIAGALVTLWFDGILRAWEAPGLLVGCAAFVGSTIVLADSPAYWAMLLAMVGCGAGVHVVARASERALERGFLDEDEERAKAAMAFDYKNTAAHALLGDVFRKRGKLREAIAEYEVCLQLQPDQLEERRKLERAVQELALQDGLERICPACGARWPKGPDSCPECGRPGTAGQRFARWVAGGGAATFLWAGLAVAAVSLLFWAVGFRSGAVVAFGVAAWLAGLGALARGLRRRPN
jgi:tetratricopeptide (TPR) repeat protein